MLHTRTPSAEEQQWLHWVAQVPCIVCAKFHGTPDTPAEIHHLDGRTKPKAHLKTIPICSKHHRIPDKIPKRWISRHGDGKGRFEAYYALESELLELTREEVKKLKANTVGEPTFGQST